jgi:Icc-related predicted phosphoesterase
VTVVATAFFVSDLHGRRERYDKLFEVTAAERPGALFLGGDLLPHPLASFESAGPGKHSFVDDYMASRLDELRTSMGAEYPRVFMILGNDDPRSEEAGMLDGESRGIWDYVHLRRADWNEFQVYGYACVPPTPFRLKDWERYDVSRYVDPGCVSPEDGWSTVPVDERERALGTIKDDLGRLAGCAELARGVFLFHTPPYQTCLDRAALDGKSVDHVPLDVHVGSVAVRRFIETRQPLVTLHGHVHESTRLTGSWRERIGRTHAFSAAHDGPELALVRFDPLNLEAASRELL